MTLQGVALVGEPGSGKTSTGEALLTLMGGKRISFAGALKDELSLLLSSHYKGRQRSVRHEMDDPATKDRFRPLLQALGSFRRDEDIDYWVRDGIRGIHPEGFFVVDDCRYPNEYTKLREFGFKFVRLESGATTRPLTGAQAEHGSEAYWRDFPVDLVLTYEAGPEHQALRIIDELGLKVPVYNELFVLAKITEATNA